MKLLFCEPCGDIIAPNPNANDVRWCRCKRHAVWWLNPYSGVLRVWDAEEGPLRSSCDGPIWRPHAPRAYVIGLTNALLRCPVQLNAVIVEELIDAHEDSYLFKRWRSLVIRIRPGESSDTAWSRLPGQELTDAAE